MWSLLPAVRLFHALLTLSVVATGVLLVSYQRQRQNLLLRSCCLVLLLMYGAIILAYIPQKSLLDEQNAFCEVQAIFLNYCYICIHAHACFMMFSNCYVAMGWKMRVFERHIDRESTLVLFSYAAPMLYIALFAFIRAHTKDAIFIRAGPFFCSIARPRFSLTIGWFAFFSIPGSLLAIYLLFKTWRARQRTLAFGSATQLTFAYLCRLSLSVFVYIVLSYGSFVPMLMYFLAYGKTHRAFYFMDSSDLPYAVVGRAGLHQLARTLPSVISYFPAVLGVAFFLMYGFGAHARASYRHFAQKYILCTSKRRNSTLPLMDGLGSASGSMLRSGSLASAQPPTCASDTIGLPLGVVEEEDPPLMPPLPSEFSQLSYHETSSTRRSI